MFSRTGSNSSRSGAIVTRVRRGDVELVPDRTTVLVSAGGFGMGPVESLVRALHEIRHPVQQRGATAFPGLYFLGLPYLTTFKSSLLLGVGEDAAYIASKIDEKGSGR